MQIYSSYWDVTILINKITNTTNTIAASSEAIHLLGFSRYPCQINYIQKRLASGTGFLKIAAGTSTELTRAFFNRGDAASKRAAYLSCC